MASKLRVGWVPTLTQGLFASTASRRPSQLTQPQLPSEQLSCSMDRFEGAAILRSFFSDSSVPFFVSQPTRAFSRWVRWTECSSR